MLGQITIFSRVFFILALIFSLGIFNFELYYHQLLLKNQLDRFSVAFLAEDAPSRLLSCLSNDSRYIEPATIIAADDCFRVAGYGWNASIEQGNNTIAINSARPSTAAFIIERKIPVLLRNESGDIEPATLHFNFWSSPLERIAGMVDTVCMNGVDREDNIDVPAAIIVEGNRVCESYNCIEVSCSVQPITIIAGFHTIKVKYGSPVSIIP